MMWWTETAKSFLCMFDLSFSILFRFFYVLFFYSVLLLLYHYQHNRMENIYACSYEVIINGVQYSKNGKFNYTYNNFCCRLWHMWVWCAFRLSIHTRVCVRYSIGWMLLRIHSSIEQCNGIKKTDKNIVKKK